ncbi:MAG: Pilin/Flagellin PilA family [Candidatus Methanohalarchaeum thermophilum]|uniref:Pilin/Flagellin PilA family n=1 Tax=Methanohalarchaeum thermophilum TaxID=1903181 RepID=A0A1Q6DTU0_METT1|nr:MAG: Pilin/Flagellin PilA family [Candidatus Methanohalarchaeum thermophilum]
MSLGLSVKLGFWGNLFFYWLGFLFLWGYSYFVYWFVFVGWFSLGFSDFFEDRDGVSPVIGVVLLVAITVIMATIVAGFVFEVIQEPNNSPLVELSIKGVDDRDNTFYIKHVTGDSIADVSSNLILYCQNSKLNENATLTVSGNNQDLDPGETLKVKVTNSTETGQIIIVEDSSNTILKATNNKFKYHQNQPPKTTNPTPSHKETDVSTNTDLAVKVTDPNNNKINTSFYWKDGTLIEEVEDVDSGSKAITSNLNLQLGKTYSWYAVADNGQETNKSNTWNFTTTTKETNQIPETTDPIPEDQTVDVSTDTGLGVDISDADGDSMNLTIKWASNGTIIKKWMNIDNGTYSTNNLSLRHDTSYDWTVNVTDGRADTSSTYTFTTIANTEPSANFTNTTLGLTVDVNASSSSDQDGNIQTYEWNWTNNETYESTGKTASHTYDSGGEYNITLRVTDDDGATDTTTETVTVQETDGKGNQAPKADAGNNNSYSANNDIELDGSGSNDPDGDLEGYLWEIIDNGEGTWNSDPNISNPSNETATLNTGKPHGTTDITITIKLTVTDDDGATDTDTIEITVEGKGGSNSNN